MGANCVVYVMQMQCQITTIGIIADPIENNDCFVALKTIHCHETN